MHKCVIAAPELTLIAPAAIFMTALFVRNLNPLPYEPAYTAQRLVLWYSERLWTHWVLLLALPFIVLVTGATLRNTWIRHVRSARQSLALIGAHLATLCVAATTLAAGGVLAIVALLGSLNSPKAEAKAPRFFFSLANSA
jgi:hypothetical protein